MGRRRKLFCTDLYRRTFEAEKPGRTDEKRVSRRKNNRMFLVGGGTDDHAVDLRGPSAKSSRKKHNYKNTIYPARYTPFLIRFPRPGLFLRPRTVRTSAGNTSDARFILECRACDGVIPRTDTPKIWHVKYAITLHLAFASLIPAVVVRTVMVRVQHPDGDKIRSITRPEVVSSTTETALGACLFCSSQRQLSNRSVISSAFVSCPTSAQPSPRSDQCSRPGDGAAAPGPRGP